VKSNRVALLSMAKPKLRGKEERCHTGVKSFLIGLKGKLRHCDGWRDISEDYTFIPNI